MHEVSIIRGIVAAALEAAERHDASRITGVTVSIGDLANISDDALRFNFEILSVGTFAEGAEVTIRRELAEVMCWDCGATNPAEQDPICPSCGGVRVKVTGGNHCYLESIDVEEAEPT
jgi:hydrogenase nickel incorporation protein HypA/HybF